MSNRTHIRPSLSPLFLIPALALAAGSAQATSGPYSGEAAVVSGEVLILGGQILGPLTVDVARAGPLPSVGGSVEARVATIGATALSLLRLGGSTAYATSVGGPGTPVGLKRVAAEAGMQGLGVAAGSGLLSLKPLVALNATVVDATALADCRGGTQPMFTATSRVTDLVVNGLRVQVTGEPNQVVEIGGLARLVINERIETRDGSSGSLEVNAVRLTLLKPGTLLSGALSGDLKLAHAEAGVNCR